MKKAVSFLKWIMVGILCTSISGCNVTSQSAQTTQDFLKNMKNYEADVKVTFLKDFQPNEMQMKQSADQDGSYEMTVVTPSYMQGVKICYDGSQTTSYNPATNETLLCKSNQARNEVLLTSFAERFSNCSNAKQEETTLDGQPVVTYEIPIEGSFKYLAAEKLWFSKEKNMPLQLVIYDQSGQVTMQVEYQNFKYNF